MVDRRQQLQVHGRAHCLVHFGSYGTLLRTVTPHCWFYLSCSEMVLYRQHKKLSVSTLPFATQALSEQQGQTFQQTVLYFFTFILWPLMSVQKAWARYSQQYHWKHLSPAIPFWQLWSRFTATAATATLSFRRSSRQLSARRTIIVSSRSPDIRSNTTRFLPTTSDYHVLKLKHLLCRWCFEFGTTITNIIPRDQIHHHFWYFVQHGLAELN